MKQKAALFDFDGTLFDTEPLNFAGYAHALKQIGYCLTKEEFHTYNGMTFKQFLPLIFPTMPLEEMLAIRKDKDAYYQSHLSLIRPNEALFSLLETIAPTYHIGLVTTSRLPNILPVLRQFGKQDCFEFIITGEDVTQLKPHPECYHKAMQHWNLSPQDTIIFEDSPVGVAAAKASGAQVFVVQQFQ